MAFRTWARLLAVTLGAGALAAASQLGVAYGLGVLRLTRVLDITTRDQWTAQLAWVAWFAMMSAVIGAVAGGLLGARWRIPSTVGTRLGLAVAAALGAATVVPLTMQPARTAQIAGVHPVFVIGICAGLGALVGLFAAYAALAQAVARWSLAALGAAVWLLAIVSVAPSLAPSDPLPAVRLGVFDAGFLTPAVTQRTALFTMPALALLIGAALGWAARRREMPTLTIALAGLAGPALLTLSYLIAGPGSGSDRYQVVPYWAAMTATGAGVLGSVLAAVLRRGADLDEDDDPDEKTAEIPVAAGAAKPDPNTTDPNAAGPNTTGRKAAGPGAPGRDAPDGPDAAGIGARETQPLAGATAAAGPVPGTDGPPPIADRPLRPADTGVFDVPPRPTPPSDRGLSDRGPSDRGLSDRGPSDRGLSDRSLSDRSLSDRSLSDRSLSDRSLSDRGPSEPAGMFGAAVPPLGGRRSSAIDAFTGRSGEWPMRRQDTTAAPGETARARGGTAPHGGTAPWSGSQHAVPEPAPYVPEPATRPLPPEAVQEPPARPARGRSRLPFGRGRSRAERAAANQPAPATPQPEVPAAAHRPEVPAQRSEVPAAAHRPEVPAATHRPEVPAAVHLPEVPLAVHLPEVPVPGHAEAEAHRRPDTGAWPGGTPLTSGRSPASDDRPASRSPLVPEPHAISAPLPEPQPISPPLPVTPAPEPGNRRGREGKRKQKDDEYVDWVSGLGGE